MADRRTPGANRGPRRRSVRDRVVAPERRANAGTKRLAVPQPPSVLLARLYTLSPMVGGTIMLAIGFASILPLWALPRESAAGISATMHVVVLGAAVGFLLRAAASGDREMRRSRLLFVASVSSVATGTLVGVGYIAVRGSIPVPSWADPLSLAWAPLAILGFWFVPTFDGTRNPTRRMLADGTLAASALAFIGWIAVVHPIAGSHRWSGFARVVELTYPVCDLLVVMAVVSLLTRARADLRTFLNVVAMGLILVAVSDSGAALRFAHSGKSSFGWPDETLQGALLLLLFAAVLKPKGVVLRYAQAPRNDRLLPYLPVVLALVLGLIFVADGGRVGLVEVSLGAAMLLVLIARQIVLIHDLNSSAMESRHAASHDALTGLPNRRAFVSALAERVRTPGLSSGAVLITDLDDFKAINDTLGHDVGDLVLQNFAEILKRAAGDNLAARLGGDEFAVLVSDEDPLRAATQIGEQLCRAVGDQMDALIVDCSVGISTINRDDTVASVLRRADLAMYAVKRGEEHSVAVYEPTMSAQFDRRTRLVAELPAAPARGEMHLMYQPIHSLKDGEFVGAEALLRWTPPYFGPVDPTEFIGLAEESGSILEVGGWALDTALKQLNSWDKTGRFLPHLFINVSSGQLNEVFAHRLRESLERLDIDASRIVLELSQSPVREVEASKCRSLLREMGVSLALDDFGSAAAPLSDLSSAAFDIVKIDRHFIQDLEQPAGRAVLDAIVNLARALGMVTIAEGVEHLSQAAEVANANIDYAQGFLFRVPVAGAELAALLPSTLVTALARLPRQRTGDHDGRVGDRVRTDDSE